MTKAVCLMLVMLAYSTLPAPAQDKEVDRLQNAGKVLAEILNVPEDIPRDLLNKADCVIVLPSVL